MLTTQKSVLCFLMTLMASLPCIERNNLTFAQERKGLTLMSKSMKQAVTQNKIDEVQQLVRTDPTCVDAVDNAGQTALLLAAEANHEKLVKFLLENGADPNYWIEELNFTPLSRASAENSVLSAKLLIQHGANIEFTQSAETKSVRRGTNLDIAAQRGHLEMVSLLVDAGAALESPGQQSPLHWACRGSRSVVYKNSTNEKMRDRFKSNSEVIKYFLEKGISINSIDSDGVAPLHIAAKYGHYDTLEFLLKNIKEVNVNVVSKSLDNAIDYLIDETNSIENKTRIDCLKLLIAHGATVTSRNLENASKANIPGVLELLEKAAKPK